MDTLITGSEGFIGKKLAQRVGSHLAIDLQKGTNLLTCSLPSEASVGTIYHLAAQASVEPSWIDPVNDSLNLPMTVRLAREYPNRKIVYAQSCASKNPQSSPYAFSKWAAGEYLKKFHHNTVICVFPNIYGPGSRSVVDIFKATDKVVVYGDGEQLRDYVHVYDIVSGLLKAKDWKPGTYYMGSGRATSVLDLAKGKDITFAPARREARESLVPNTTPNWEPTLDVFDYLHES